MKKILYIIAILILIVLVFLISTQTSDAPVIEGVDWRGVDLVDARTGDVFKINDFAGEVILLESFAVWCPTCLRQQKEMKEVDGVVHISLDTDPNENVELVKDHSVENGLDWRFAVSPIDLTKALIDEFGLTIVNAPSAPVVLICGDQSARLLRKGVKTAEELNVEIKETCLEN